jgi:MFS family permease
MAGMGLARWAYPPILPSMKAGLGLNYTQAGLLSSADMAGYTGFAIVVGVLASRGGPRRVIAGGLLLAGCGMLLTGVALGFEMALMARFLTGIGVAGASITTFSLVPRWFARRRRGFAMGVLITGTPVSLLLVGQTLPRLLAAFGEAGWRYVWLLLGAVALATCVAAVMLLRNHPSEKGLKPLWAEEDSDGASVNGSAADGNASLRAILAVPVVWQLMAIMGLQGYAYVAYATFFVSHLMKNELTLPEVGNLWTLIGVLALVAPLWGAVSDRLGRRPSLAVSFVMLFLALVLFAVGKDTPVLTISVVVFGLSVNAVGTIVPAAVPDYVGERAVPTTLGLLFFVFGVAMSLAPAVSGAVADSAGSFTPAFLLAAGVASVGFVASLTLRPPVELAELKAEASPVN